ncbi:threonine dehydratase [Antricoccus suffuscus]|uniref:threonine ammonia-lyase n=1 Tax=Antricoccus suffuscus TaxID=1629062 RepID=A0A2T0ZRW1_9ACTN|nr:pyridoxal-phosphate dependent enzyme [Antricoccus suffuscus]PRZ39089.1 threonine dehydratase [Antricoccus suffuscus]
MELVTIDDIRQAAKRIEGDVVRTSLVPIDGTVDRTLWVKPESLQPIGAFKLRGASNAVAQAVGRTSTVITHSSGNHGQAIAMAAAAHGLRAIVVIPDDAPQIKIDAVRARGAQIVLVPGEERASRVEQLAAQKGALVIAPYDDHDVIAGQGTVGLEIAEDLPELPGGATVLVPVGGGGLLSGVSTALAALRPDVRVVGVEPELAGDAAESFHRHTLIRWPRSRTARTIADGLRSDLADRTFAHIEKYVSDIVTVTEEQIIEACRFLYRRGRLVTEPSGAVATAGFFAHPQVVGDRAVAVISGGNVDPHWYAENVVTSSAPR